MDATLQKSFKRRYPFRLATTSFIYPTDWVTNVHRLGPYLDEIELLLLESRPDSLPTGEEIAALVRLGDELDLTYNIHLSYDLSACDPDPDTRLRAVAALKQVIDLTAPLMPTTHTLHLPFHPERPGGWLQRAEDSIARLAAEGVPHDALSIETLDYPFELLQDILERRDLSVCIDVGHLIIHEMDLGTTLDYWMPRTAIVHLHGVDGKRDHLSLDRMPPERLRSILKRLQTFKGTVSIEVFSFDHLSASLATLERQW
jgi:sugar phosphate isomerase/epimerase